MPTFEFSTYCTVEAPSEGEARGKLGMAQELLETVGVQLSIEDGVPIELDEEEEKEY